MEIKLHMNSLAKDNAVQERALWQAQAIEQVP
jgi:hypothetical protein